MASDAPIRPFHLNLEETSFELVAGLGEGGEPCQFPSALYPQS